MREPTVYPDEASWLAQRPKNINASEVSTILGLNPHCSAYTLWAEKSGLIDGPDVNFWMKWGHRVERPILDAFQEETGVKLQYIDPYAVWTHPDSPWLRCTPDDLGYSVACKEPDCVVEAKSSMSFHVSERMDNSGDALLEHQIQVQIQMACTGLKKGYIAAVVPRLGLQVYDYDYDPELIERVIPKLRQFLSMVESGVAPDPDASDSTTETLKLLHPDDNGLECVFDSAMAGNVARWKVAKQREKEAAEGVKLYANIIRAALKDNTYGLLPDGSRVSWKTQERKEYTVEAGKSRVLRAHKH